MQKNNKTQGEDFSDNDAVFDFDRLKEFTEDDSRLYKKIIGTFIHNLEKDIATIQTSLNKKDYTKWSQYVHKLYGSCSHIGANALAKVCHKGQDLPKSDTNEIHEAHSTIMKEYRVLLKTLQG